MTGWFSMKKIIICLLLLCSHQAFAVWQQPELSHNLTPLTKPVRAYPFALQDIDDETVSLQDYKGKVVMLNFWATWCPPCVREMPSMQRLYEKFRQDGFVVLALDQMESEDDVFTFTAQLELEPEFPILFDRESKVSRQYQVHGLPTTYLIDKNGMIRYRAVGGRLFDHIAVLDIIKQLLNE